MSTALNYTITTKTVQKQYNRHSPFLSRLVILVFFWRVLLLETTHVQWHFPLITMTDSAMVSSPNAAKNKFLRSTRQLFFLRLKSLYDRPLDRPKSLA